MAGILEQKSRILDFILTPTGRRQSMNGSLRIKYASFSDSGAIYDGDSKNILDVSDANIGLESFPLPWDQIVVETDDNGKLYSFAGADANFTPDGIALFSGSIQNIASSSVELISSSSLESFNNLQLIKTFRPSTKDEGLIFNTGSYTFSIESTRPFNGEPSETNVDDVDSIFSSARFSKNLNFLYLPPVQSDQASGQDVSLGTYFEANEISNTENVFKNLEKLEYFDFSASKNTESNKIIIQAFEEIDNSVTKRFSKLDVIPFETDSSGRTTLYFVGKVFTDSVGVPKFVNIFTMVVS